MGNLPYRSECKCGCHTRPGMMHITACCQPDHRMTPTNDASVTVEQLEMQAHRLDRIREDNDRPTLTDRAVLRETADMLRRLAAFPSAPAVKLNRDFTARRIKELMDEGDGFWTACSGCQEGEDGYVSEKDYPFDPMFRCQPGGGCSECGGIGVLWDDGRGYDDITGDEEPASAPAGDGVEDRYSAGYSQGTIDADQQHQWMQDKAWQDAVLMLVHYSTVAERTWLVDHDDAARKLAEWWGHARALADTKTADDIAALARPRAAVGERAWDGVVATDPCQSADDTDEDGNPCWYIEIQSIGGHSIVATIWGGSAEEVQTRANAILALQSPPAKVEG